eukprot:7391003-Prymnesium_polylepis.1
MQPPRCPPLPQTATKSRSGLREPCAAEGVAVLMAIEPRALEVETAAGAVAATPEETEAVAGRPRQVAAAVPGQRCRNACLRVCVARSGYSLRWPCTRRWGPACTRILAHARSAGTTADQRQESRPRAPAARSASRDARDTTSE